MMPAIMICSSTEQAKASRVISLDRMCAIRANDDQRVCAIGDNHQPAMTDKPQRQV